MEGQITSALFQCLQHACPSNKRYKIAYIADDSYLSVEQRTTKIHDKLLKYNTSFSNEELDSWYHDTKQDYHNLLLFEEKEESFDKMSESSE